MEKNLDWFEARVFKFPDPESGPFPDYHQTPANYSLDNSRIWIFYLRTLLKAIINVWAEFLYRRRKRNFGRTSESSFKSSGEPWRRKVGQKANWWLVCETFCWETRTWNKFPNWFRIVLNGKYFIVWYCWDSYVNKFCFKQLTPEKLISQIWSRTHLIV